MPHAAGGGVGVIGFIDEGRWARFGLNHETLAAAGLRGDRLQRPGCLSKIGASQLHSRQHGERVLNQMATRRAEPVGDALPPECRR